MDYSPTSMRTRSPPASPATDLAALGLDRSAIERIFAKGVRTGPRSLTS
ncbi:MAG TPA: hypothetical protein VIU11_03100 [Nakamurella sp.]